MHCHHEKLVIVDDEVAFVGGIDLTSLSGDRWDGNAHPARGRLGWHDVATRLRGPAVADVAEHFRARWQEVARRAAAAADTAAAARRDDRPGAAHRPRRHATRSSRAATSASSRRTCARCASAQRLDLPGEPVPVVGRDRRDPRGQAAPTRRTRTSVSSCCSPRARTTAPTRRAASSAGSSRPHDGSDRLLAATISCRSGARTHAALRAREGRDRRRPLADDRLREPQRALALQRHRDERAHAATSGSRARTRLELWAEHLELPARAGRRRSRARVDRRAVAPDRARSSSACTAPACRARTGLMELPAVSRRAKRLIGPMRGLLVDG